MPTLILAFEGPWQSWGSGSKFDYRQTEPIPKKSGVIGMIAAAMGRKREESLLDLNQLELTIRIDQPGIVCEDFQTMKVAGQEHPYISHKFYLADAKFLVCLTHPSSDFLKEIATALNHPFYPIYLGRRNCPPAGKLVRDLINEEDGEAAARSYPWLASEWFKKKHQKPPQNLRIFKEGNGGFRQIRLKDLPVSFERVNRQYKNRLICEVSSLSVENTPPTIDIDFFEEAKYVSQQD